MGILNDIKQNHALEHATVAHLLRQLEGNVRVIGRASLTGFYLYGDIPTEAVEKASGEALQRLQEGEEGLAVSPMCGTNLIVSGLAAGVASMVAARGHKGLSRFSRVVKASIIAMLVAQPLGRLAQKHVTTTADVANVAIKGVVRSGEGKRTRHKIEIVHL